MIAPLDSLDLRMRAGRRRACRCMLGALLLYPDFRTALAGTVQPPNATPGESPLKVILASRRHPSMSRAEFYTYLTARHAPLVQGIPEVMRYFRKYVQNHARLVEDGAPDVASFARATDRDSVIELWFDSRNMFQSLLKEPKYRELVRPDEARFNDLNKLVILATREHAQHWNAPGSAPTPVKTFDFIRRKHGLSREEFFASWRGYEADLMRSEPYRRSVAAHVWNASVQEEDNPFGAPSDYDGVLETWFADYAALEAFQRHLRSSVLLIEKQQAFVDRLGSFSVVAAEVPIYDNLGRGTG